MKKPPSRMHLVVCTNAVDMPYVVATFPKKRSADAWAREKGHVAATYIRVDAPKKRAGKRAGR